MTLITPTPPCSISSDPQSLPSALERLLPNLGDLLEAVRQDTSLADHQRRDIASAINIVSKKWFNVETPAQVPLVPHRLRTRIAAIRPKQVGLTRERFARIKRDFGKALEKYAKILRPRRARTEDFSKEWAEIFAQFPGRDHLTERSTAARLAAAGIALHPVIGYLNTNGIQPHAARPEHIEGGYFGLLKQDPLLAEKRVKLIISNVRSKWNLARTGVQGWPDFELQAPKRQFLAIPLSEFLPVFAADIQDFIERRGVPKLDVELPPNPSRVQRNRARRKLGIPRKAWKKLALPTVNARVYAVVRGASALVRQGRISIDEITSIASAATIDAADALATEFLGDAEAITGTCSNWISEILAAAIRWRRDLGRDEHDEFLDLIEDLDDELSLVRPGRMSPRVRERLTQFTPEVIAQIDRIPAAAMQAVKSAYLANGRKPVSAELARHARSALGVFIEMRLCPRRRTLTLTHFDRNFVYRPDGTARISYTSKETKTGQGIEAELTTEEVKWFRLFEQACMPVLVQRGNRYLFGSSEGDKTMNAAIVAAEVCDMVRDETHCDIHLHLFRALLASTLLAEDPKNNLDLVRALLGHAPDSKEVEKYAALSSLWATDAVRKALKAQAASQPLVVRRQRRNR